MNYIIKTILAMLALAVFVLFAVGLYWNRNQNIDFSLISPKQFKHCGFELKQNSPEHIGLMTWFKSHKSGWENSSASYVTASQYTSPILNVNVMNELVIVNYEQSTGSWTQVVHKKSKNELINKCNL